jgi:hypothetical protein
MASSVHSVRADPDRMPENRGVRAVRFQAQFESLRGNPIARDRLPSRPAIDMTMWSGMLSGFGRGRQVELSSDHSGAEPMNIEANRWVPRAFARAAPLGKPLPAGLVLSPADTRVGTVSAIAYASRVGTIDPRRIGKLQRNLLRVNRRPATLVFFDRPCSLVGTWVENTLQAQVEIYIPGTGFYWLTWVEDAPGRFHMNATTTPEDAELVFVIS